MLTQDQQKYLETIPEDRTIIIQDFNPSAKETALEIMKRIKSAGVKSEVLNMGSTELEIAGQNDIDINILSSPDRYKEELPILENLFGQPFQRESLPMRWEFKEKGFGVDLHLTDTSTENFKQHLDIFSAFKNNQSLLKEYEELKRSCSGKSLREYMIMKYEFFNEILK